MVAPLPLALLLAASAHLVDAGEAARMLADGAVALDVRPAAAFARGHVAGAVPVPGGVAGLLPDAGDERLAEALGAVGVWSDRPVLVVGALPADGGAVGWLAWVLAYLGHPRVAVLDGGFAAWEAADRPVETGDATPVRAGPERPFVPRRVEAERARIDEVAARARGAVLLDVRTPAEWSGATPYGEARGGHIPGARHLPWTDLVDARGRVLAPTAARRRLAAAGVPPGAPVIVYCTSGARSGFAWLVLRSLGYRARNFDASFRAWAAEPSLPVAPR